ncbi:MAG: DUF883 C-terminal domain-containing protein [Balneolaceae bacterium]
MKELNDELEYLLTEGRDLLEDLNLEERLEEVRTELELFIRKHPLKSMVASAAIGFVIAGLLRR